MAGVELATAFVSLVPSARGIGAAVSRELTQELTGIGGVAQRAGGEAGQGFGSRFAAATSSAVRSIGSAFVNTFRAAAVTAGTVAAAALGGALFSGFRRFTTIQDAGKALTISLQDSTKAAGLLNQVLSVVKGTPFSLDQFAQAAQQLVGFGVEAGRIPGILTAIGDASATQGKQAGQFAGQLTDVFGQIAAKGQVQLEDVWRISETGVNALAILANHFGVTTDAMKNMISAGAVPASVALDVLTQGIEKGSSGIAGTTVALGGTMRALGDTVSGGLANMGTGFARFGASIIAPFSGALVTGFKAVTAVLDDLGARFGPALTKFASSPGFKAFTDWLSALPSKVGPVLDGLGRLGPLLAPLAGGLGAVAASAGPLGALLPNINPLVAGFAALALTSPQLRAAFEGLFRVLAPVVTQLGTQLATALQSLIPAIAPVIEALGPALTAVLTALGPVITALAPPIAQVLGVLAQLLVPVGQLVAALAPIVGLVLQLAATVVAALLPALQPLLTVLAQVVAQIATALQPVIAALIPVIQQNVGVLAQFLQALLPILPALGQLIIALLPILPPLFELLTLQIRMAAVLVPVIALVAQLAAVLIGALAVAVKFVVGFLVDFIGWLTRIPENIGGALAAIGNFAGKVLDFFTGLPGKIVSAIGDLAGTMFHLGVDAMESLGRGLWSMIGKLGDIAGSIKDKLVETLDPRNWFSTPEEHYRMLWGAAFASIADEGLRSLGQISHAVDAVTAAGTPQLALANLGGVSTLTVAPAALPVAATTVADSGHGTPQFVSGDVFIDGHRLDNSLVQFRPASDRRNRRVNQ